MNFVWDCLDGMCDDIVVMKVTDDTIDHPADHRYHLRTSPIQTCYAQDYSPQSQCLTFLQQTFNPITPTR